MGKFLRTVFLVDLLQGLWVTFRNQHPKYIYTEQYPSEPRHLCTVRGVGYRFEP